MALENDFLPFATAAGANVVAQSAYAGASYVPAGRASGILPSNVYNKVARQSSIASFLIGNLINNEANQTALDNGDLVTLYNNFVAALGVVANNSGAATLPEGRLTLASEVPIITGTIIGATEIIYTPYMGNRVPVWNGVSFSAYSIGELNQSLSDATLSPAAAVGGAIYDIFEWLNPSTNAVVISRGPAWANTTLRTVGLTRVQGILVNAAPITNGPAFGYGVYLGTIMTDPAGATCSYNPYPAAASGGPSGGAWIGLWNYYNRVSVSAVAQDSASWTYASTTWRQADGSGNNTITFVTGAREDSILCDYQVSAVGAGGTGIVIGIGIDSVTTPSIGHMDSMNNSIALCKVTYAGASLSGHHYLSAMEAAVGSLTFYGTSEEYSITSAISAQIMQLSALLRY